jgi:hypothetical protein
MIQLSNLIKGVIFLCQLWSNLLSQSLAIFIDNLNSGQQEPGNVRWKTQGGTTYRYIPGQSHKALKRIFLKHLLGKDPPAA